MSIYQEISDADASLNIQIRLLSQILNESRLQLHQLIVDYLQLYCDFYGFDVGQVISSHLRFLQRFSEDLNLFVSTGKFPFQLGRREFQISREEYDLSLLLSTVLVEHRFRIMEYLYSADTRKGKSLLVGAGSGLEISLINRGQPIDAFDLSLSDFVKSYCSCITNISLHEEQFVSAGREAQYSSIFLIEVLEHVEAPYQLLSEACQSLAGGGKIYATTIKNVPQFDHIYNFIDEQEFEKKALNLGLSVPERRVLPHVYFKHKSLDANNTCYTLQKKRENNCRNDPFDSDRHSVPK